MKYNIVGIIKSLNNFSSKRETKRHANERKAFQMILIKNTYGENYRVKVNPLTFLASDGLASRYSIRFFELNS
jgi:hypothetical protein